MKIAIRDKFSVKLYIILQSLFCFEDFDTDTHLFT